jgi:hypothetical protein
MLQIQLTQHKLKHTSCLFRTQMSTSGVYGNKPSSTLHLFKVNHLQFYAHDLDGKEILSH